MKRRLEFLEAYKDRIIEEHSPIVNELRIDPNGSIETIEDMGRGTFTSEFRVNMAELNISIEDITNNVYVLINSSKKEPDPLLFSLSGVSVYSIIFENGVAMARMISEDDLATHEEWYLVKLNEYFMVRSLERVRIKIESTTYSKIDRYLLGVEKIPEQAIENENEAINDSIFEGLNETQIKALKNAIFSKDISIIKGPPGTGKTTTIERFIRHSLIANPEKRIIFMTNLHSSMDALFKKMDTSKFYKDIDVLRVTKKYDSRVSRRQKFLTKTKSANVYISTIASQRMNVIIEEKSALFQEKPILIIDEASTTSLLHLLSHTKNVEKLLIIGDDQQLLPIYNRDDANYFAGLGMSEEFEFFLKNPLFNFVYENNKERSVMLDVNYRSRTKIVDFINHFYKGELKYKKGEEGSINVVKTSSFEEGVKKLQKLIDLRNLTKNNTLFLCEYRASINMFNKELGKKIFKTTTSTQGDEMPNVVLFLTPNPRTGNGRSQLDYRTINVAISRAQKNVYIIDTNNIVNKSLIDISNGWIPYRVNGKSMSIVNILQSIYK